MEATVLAWQAPGASCMKAIRNGQSSSLVKVVAARRVSAAPGGEGAMLVVRRIKKWQNEKDQGKGASEKERAKAAPEKEAQQYRLKEGEWVSELAERLGVRVQDLQALNPSVNLDRVFPRQVILIPKPKAGFVEDPREALPLRHSVEIVESLEAESEPQAEAELDVAKRGQDDGAAFLAAESSGKGQDGSINGRGVGAGESRGSEPLEEAKVEYMVQPGDYLADIAARHGVKLKALISVNKLNYEDRIRVGQILLLPPDEPSHFEIQKTSQVSSVWRVARGLPNDPIFQAAALLSGIVVACGMVVAKGRQQPVQEGGRKVRVVEPELSGRSGRGFWFGRSRYLQQLEGAAQSVASTIQSAIQGTDGTMVGHGFATGKSQQEAVEAAFRAALSSLKRPLAIVSVFSLSRPPQSRIPAGVKAADAAALLTKLLPEELPSFSGVMTLGGGGFLSLANLESKEGSLGEWAAVLLFAAPENSIKVGWAAQVVGLQQAVQTAAEGLKRKLVGSAKLKAVVANVSGINGKAALDELASSFPKTSLYEVSAAGANLSTASDWQLTAGDAPSSVIASEGVILFGLTTDAGLSGAFFASVLGQWLYGRHVHVDARPPFSPN